MEKKIYILKKVLSLLLVIVLIFCVFKLFIFYIPFVISYIISSLLSPIIDKLTSRTKIWDAAIGLIKERILLGYGQNSYIWEQIIPIGSAHNKYLQLLYDNLKI